MTHEGTADDRAVVSNLVSVTFKPEALTGFEQWRWVLVRMAPTWKRPVLRVTAAVVYFLFALPFLGFVIGMAGWPNLQPGTMAVAAFALAFLYPFRLWRIKSAAMRLVRGLGPLTVELDDEGVTTRFRNRVTRIDWAGVVEVRSTAYEVVLRYQAGDASWIPTGAFADLEHEARFLHVAEDGLARSRPETAATVAPGSR